MTVGERIRQKRKEKGYTIKELAFKAGISAGNVSEIENDKYMPGAEKLISLCKILECSIDWVLTGNSEFRNENKNEISKISITQKFLLNLFEKLNEDNQSQLIDIMESMLKKQNSGIITTKTKDIVNKNDFF